MTLVYFVNWAIAAQGDDDDWVLSTGWRYMLAVLRDSGRAVRAAAAVRAGDAARAGDEGPEGKGARRAAAACRTKTKRNSVLAEIEASLSGHQRQALRLRRPRRCSSASCCRCSSSSSASTRCCTTRPLMFKNMGAPRDASLLQTIIMGVANGGVHARRDSSPSISWGRKPLLILGALIMAVSMIALGTCSLPGNVGPDRAGRGGGLHRGLLAVLGPGGVGAARGDLPERHQGKAMAIAVAAQWFANLFVSWTFKILDGNSGAERHVQPWLRLLALRRHERARRAVRLQLRAGDARASRSRPCRSSWSPTARSRYRSQT